MKTAGVLFRWDLRGVDRRHVMCLHIRDRLFPNYERGGIARALERRLEVDPGFEARGVAANTAISNKGLHALPERDFGIRLERCKINRLHT